MNSSSDLVSVCIITYNSEEFIQETLESIRLQTYHHIELIISDDFSTDNTISLCKEWIFQNKTRFVKCEIVETIKNTGLAANCNRAITKATGNWIKILAGDDLLSSDAIEEYINYVSNTKFCKIAFAKLNFFGSDSVYTNAIALKYESSYYPYIKLDNKEQFDQVLKSMYIPSPGLFILRSLWQDVGGYDENYPFCEEYPITYNILAKGERIFFIDKYLVHYRVRDNSLCREDNRMNIRVFNDFRSYFLEKRRKNMIKHGYIFLAWHETITLYIKSLSYKYDANSLFLRLSNILYLFSPQFYFNRIKKIFNSLFEN